MNDELLRYAAEAAGSGHDIAAHVMGCAACTTEVARLQAAVSLLRSHANVEGEQTLACLDDDTVAAWAAGEIARDVGVATMSHLASCAYCRSRVASVARALAAPAVAREIAAAEAAGARRRSDRRILLPLGVGAAAALLFAVLPRGGDEANAPHRAPTITAAPAPVPQSPIGVQAAAESLRWAGVAGADRYRVTLFDAGGRVLYEIQLADTTVALPDSVALAPAQPYLWKVEARTGWDRWATSQLVGFSIAGGALPP